ncbi:MAG: hypothetical protein K0Q72_4510 [Armatimonadetes bacterium]|nr:hypothetical protein [Armatimonadota bacterium]
MLSYYRRMRARLGPPGAITATAHRLVRIYSHLVTTREAYEAEEQRHQQRREARLKREATALGFTLTPTAAAAWRPATPSRWCLNRGLRSQYQPRYGVCVACETSPIGLGTARPCVGASSPPLARRGYHARVRDPSRWSG